MIFTHSRFPQSAIETLEARIAPAAVFTYTDVDGDTVTIKTSRGTNSELEAILTFKEVGIGLKQLQLIDFSTDADFAGTDLTITAKKSATGDGRVNVGYIDAYQNGNGDTGIDLGKVTIKGDIGGLSAGDSNLETAAIKSLNVLSFGAFRGATETAGYVSVSFADGPINSVKIAGDFQYAVWYADKIGKLFIGGSVIGGDFEQSGTISATEGIDSIVIKGDILGSQADGSGVVVGDYIKSAFIGGSVIGGSGESSGIIAAVKEFGSLTIRKDLIGGSNNRSGGVGSGEILQKAVIGGSIIGGTGNESGIILALGDVGSLKIGGNVTGGEGNESAFIDVNGDISNITIGGSLTGGNGEQSGSIQADGTANVINIGKDLVGGAGILSGRVRAGEFAAPGNGFSIRIGGNMIGGSGNDSGQIFSPGDIGPVRIGGNLIGGSIAGSASLNGSGLIQGDHLERIAIGGSLIAGIDKSTGSLSNSGAIRASEDIGALEVKGSIIGNASNAVLITARGQTTPSADLDLAIGQIKVGKHVEYTNILAGYSETKTPMAINGNASIGTVIVGRDWATSSLVAGVRNLGVDDMPGGTGLSTDNINFGNNHDVLIGNGDDALIARIAKIQIGGVIKGTSNIPDDFGFVAQQIDAFKVGGVSVPRTAEKDASVALSPLTNDVTIREV